MDKMTVEQIEEARRYFKWACVDSGKPPSVDWETHVDEIFDLAKIALTPPQDVAGLVSELRELAEKATQGPWGTDEIANDGGFKSYAVGAGPPNKWKPICNTLNSDLIEIEGDFDEHGATYWDEQGKHNAAYIAAANPANMTKLLDCITSLSARNRGLEAALRPFAKEALQKEPTFMRHDLNKAIEVLEGRAANLQGNGDE